MVEREVIQRVGEIIIPEIEKGDSFWSKISNLNIVSGATGRPYLFLDQVLVAIQTGFTNGACLTENQMIKRDMSFRAEDRIFSVFPNPVLENMSEIDSTGRFITKQHFEWGKNYLHFITENVIKNKKSRTTASNLDNLLNDNCEFPEYLTYNIALAMLKNIYTNMEENLRFVYVYGTQTPQDVIKSFVDAERIVTGIVFRGGSLPRRFNNVMEIVGVKPEDYHYYGAEWTIGNALQEIGA